MWDLLGSAQRFEGWPGGHNWSSERHLLLSALLLLPGYLLSYPPFLGSSPSSSDLIFLSLNRINTLSLLLSLSSCSPASFSSSHMVIYFHFSYPIRKMHYFHQNLLFLMSIFSVWTLFVRTWCGLRLFSGPDLKRERRKEFGGGDVFWEKGRKEEEWDGDRGTDRRSEPSWLSHLLRGGHWDSH